MTRKRVLPKCCCCGSMIGRGCSNVLSECFRAPRSRDLAVDRSLSGGGRDFCLLRARLADVPGASCLERLSGGSCQVRSYVYIYIYICINVHVMTCHVTSRHVTSRHVTSCPVRQKCSLPSHLFHTCPKRTAPRTQPRRTGLGGTRKRLGGVFTVLSGTTSSDFPWGFCASLKSRGLRSVHERRVCISERSPEVDSSFEGVEFWDLPESQRLLVRGFIVCGLTASKKRNARKRKLKTHNVKNKKQTKDKKKKKKKHIWIGFSSHEGTQNTPA